MIHELREYVFEALQWPAYRKLFLEMGRPIRGDAFGVLLGAWTMSTVLPETDDGRIRFLHLWAYDSLDHRAALRNKMAQIPAWTHGFLPTAAQTVSSQTLRALVPQNEATLRCEITVAESSFLHRWQTRVGNANVLLQILRAQPGNLWSTEFPDPNEVTWLTSSALPLSVSTDEQAVLHRHTIFALRALPEALPVNPSEN